MYLKAVMGSSGSLTRGLIGLTVAAPISPALYLELPCLCLSASLRSFGMNLIPLQDKAPQERSYLHKLLLVWVIQCSHQQGSVVAL